MSSSNTNSSSSKKQKEKWCYRDMIEGEENPFQQRDGVTKLMNLKNNKKIMLGTAPSLVLLTLLLAAVPIITTQQQQAYAQITPSPSPTNATTTNATNTTTTTIGPMDPNVPASATAPPPTVGTTQIITNLTWYTNINPEALTNPLAEHQMGERADPLSETNIQYQQSDPAFLKLAQTTYDCLQHYNEITKKVEANPQFGENPGSGVAYTSEDIQRQDLCTDIISQGIASFCEGDFATLDLAKCDEAKKMSEPYVYVTEILYG